MRNPGRTATTAAALMVGLGLVVFVAVFAASLKSSFTKSIEDLVSSDLIIREQNFNPLPGGVERAVADTPGVRVATGVRFDEIARRRQVEARLRRHPERGRPGPVRRGLPDPLAEGIRRAVRPPVRRHRADRGAVRQGAQAVGRRNVRRAHRERRPGPVARGRHLPRPAAHVRRDRLPCAVRAALGRARSDSPARGLGERHRPEAGPGRGQAIAPAVPGGARRVERRVPRDVRGPAQPDRRAALRAAGDEPRDLGVRHRQRAVPDDPRAHARARPAAGDRVDALAGAAGWSSTRASSPR